MMFIIISEGRACATAELGPTYTSRREAELRFLSISSKTVVFFSVVTGKRLFYARSFFNGANNSIMGIPVQLEPSGNAVLV